MKRKIVLLLFTLFMFFTIGSVTAMLYIRSTTTELKHIIKLHQVEELRRSLLIDIQTAQSDLYTVHTKYGHDLNYIVNNVTNIGETAEQCSSCHHPPLLSRRIENIQYMINDYETALRSYIKGPINSERSGEFKLTAASIGNKLFTLIRDMSHNASNNLEGLTNSTMIKVAKVRTILFITLIATFLLGVLVAANLMRFITRPVKELVNATRMISSGKLGSTISYKDSTEFGELAGHFNSMSTAIKDGYEKIQREITERKQTEEALVKSERFLSTIFDSILDPFCIIDHDCKIVKVNEAYAEMKNVEVDYIIGKKCYEVLQDRDIVCRDCIVSKTFKAGDPCSRDKLFTLPDEAQAWLEIYTYPIFGEGGRVSHVIEYIRDISERKRVESDLIDSKERYALAARGANDGLWDWDLKTNSIYYSPRWKSMLGLVESDINDSPDEWLKRVHPDDRKHLEKDIASHINGGTIQFESEYRVLHKDGTYRWMLSRGVAVRDSAMKAYRMAGSQTDITIRKMAEEQLHYDAFHDSLTGLPNRALFMDRLRHAIIRAKRNDNYFFAVLFLDMDRFKVLNDSLGHTIGDEMLVAVSKRLEESLRPGDTVARLGGDEFSVILDDITGDSEVLHITERIQKKLSLPFNLDGQEVFMTASIGIAFSTTGYDRPEHLLRDADIAMYHAKTNGRARHEIFNIEMYDRAVARLQLETNLRQAIKQNELKLQYQPIVSMKTGGIKGLEALVRWNHPVIGLINPTEFIPLAEETGLIIQLGEWVIEEACRQLSIWQKQFPSEQPLTISVNISSKQLSPGLLEHIKRVLEETGVAPESFIVEITESMIMENAETVAPLLLRLKDMKVKLHIDDFGTGYSSLSYLHRFPVDMLKIDRSFISRLGSNGENLKIVKAIAALAHSLNMSVIAEGVETEEQLLRLKRLKCGYMQGFLFSRPLDSKEAEALLREGRLNLFGYLTHSSVRN
jgi:diguanylate cyclase (GGDEF)-like protein/PAS domain S-box-containing protein